MRKPLLKTVPEEFKEQIKNEWKKMSPKERENHQQQKDSYLQNLRNTLKDADSDNQFAREMAREELITYVSRLADNGISVLWDFIIDKFIEQEKLMEELLKEEPSFSEKETFPLPGVEPKTLQGDMKFTLEYEKGAFEYLEKIFDGEIQKELDRLNKEGKDLIEYGYKIEELQIVHLQDYTRIVLPRT